MRGTIGKITGKLPVLGLLALAAGCNSGGGPTAIEIPIDRLEIVAACGAIAETETCTFRAEAFSGTQQVANPVLRWSSSNSTVATVEEQGTSAVVRGRQSGQVSITVSNTTGTVSDSKTMHVIQANPK
jgi:hypothetical protein